MKKSSFYLLLIVLVALIAGVNLFAHGGEDHGEETGSTSTPTVASGLIHVSKETQFGLGVFTDAVSIRGLYNSLSTKGIVRAVPSFSAELYPPMAGRITVITPRKTGDYISKGQALFAVQQVLTGTESLVLEQELAAAKRELDEATRELERKKALQDIISKKEFELAEIRERTARTRYASLQSARSRGTQSVTVTAPISGYITFSNLVNGTYADPAQRLVEIIDVSTVWVETQVYESDLQMLASLSEAIITTASGETYRARYISRNNVIDPETRALSVIFAVSNSDRGLPINSTVDVGVVTQGLENVQAIPKSALITQSGKSFVILHQAPEEFKIAEIITGTRADEKFIEVRSGVSVGDRVVTTNHSLFRQSLPQ